MRAALSFGRRNMGRTAPNPCVGALVVRDGVVIGRGVTAPGGRPHAEPQALEQAGTEARGATLVVTLEPCSHHGRAGPCADAIVAAGVARVVVASLDPDPRVSGRGVARLRAAGIAVTTGVCDAIARRDHLGHIRRVTVGRPAVTLKLAATSDGFAAAPPDHPRLLITGPAANAWTHQARAMHDAVIVGAGTLRQDDPLLTVRLPGMEARQPLRVALAEVDAMPPTSRLALSAAAHPVLLLTAASAADEAMGRLRRLGVDIRMVEAGPDGRPDPKAALGTLAERGVTRLFCEGGPRLAASLLARDLVDEVALLTGPRALGISGLPALDEGARSILADPHRFRLVEDRSLGEDRLRRYERCLPCSPD